MRQVDSYPKEKKIKSTDIVKPPTTTTNRNIFSYPSEYSNDQRCQHSHLHKSFTENLIHRGKGGGGELISDGVASYETRVVFYFCRCNNIHNKRNENIRVESKKYNFLDWNETFFYQERHITLILYLCLQCTHDQKVSLLAPALDINRDKITIL